MDDKFNAYFIELRKKEFESFENIILYHDHRVFFYQFGDCIRIAALNLAKYNVINTLIRAILYYSHKDQHLDSIINRISDLTIPVQEQLWSELFRSAFDNNLVLEELYQKSSDELHDLADQLYLDELSINCPPIHPLLP